MSGEIGEEAQPPIMRLPREIRGLIFSKLEESEMVRLRCVCSHFRSEVDDFCEFSVVLDERQPYLERIGELRIQRCKVLHLLEPLPHIIFFKYPGLLRSLKILTEKISPENFHILCQDATRNLKEFCAVLPLPLLKFEGCSPMKFDNLSRLKLSISTVPEGPIMGPPRLEDNLLHRIFNGLKKKKLKMMAVGIRCVGFQQVSKLTSRALTFIGENHESLEHVDFDMIQGHGMVNFNEIRALSESHMESINFTELGKVCNLKSLRIVNSTAIGIDLWCQVLAQQRSLQFLETDILPVSNELYKQVILNNEDTLVHIDIGDLTLNEEDNLGYFDASVFQNCKHLKKLTLDRNTIQLRRHEPDRAELINLHCLPEYLEELAINYFTLLSDELLILFNSRENLKSLALTQCGDYGDFGVDGSVLERILSMRDICFIEISPLNFTNPEERLKLNAILTTFGYTEGHSYFQLSKVSHNFQIQFEDFTP